MSNTNPKQRQIKFIANVVKWFDRVNGNTYHSVNITRARDGKTLYCPYQYGYGDQYRQTALESMVKAKWIPKRYNERHSNGFPLFMEYERENNYPVMWNVTDGLKREMVANGQEV